MSDYTECAAITQQKKDFAPTKETLIQVLMQTGLVTIEQAEGLAETTIMIERVKCKENEG